MFFKKLNEYIFDNKLDIRERIFVLNTLMIDFVLAITGVELLSFFGMVTGALASFLIGVVISVVAYQSVKRNKVGFGTFAVCIVMGFVYFPVMFLFDGGMSGTGPLWFMFSMLILCTSLKGRVRMVMIIAEEIAAFSLYMVCYLKPDLTDDVSGTTHFMFSFITLFLITSSIAVMLVIENMLYIKQSELLEKQSEEIKGLIASQNSFFSSMSHEIRTPINTIIGLNEMILREDISEEIAQDAINIRSAGKMLLNTINDILDMSKFQAGDMHLLVESYDTGHMFSDIVGMLWIKMREKELEFKINVAPDVPSQLIGDEVRIKQILMNILNNAVKYTPEGSVTLTVECEKQEGQAVKMIYTVADTGMGIKKEDIPYLFTAFKRVDEGQTKHIEGTGLGLSIVKQFLDLMDGKVTVNSVYTKGTTFIIEIPQKAATDKEIGEYDYAKHPKLAYKTDYKQSFEAPEARLLVVDDNDSNLLVVTKLLRETKIRIDTAKSGREALEKTLENEYNLIFMDHLMPEMDGIETFRAIKKQVGGKNRETNVVILTANTGEENRRIYATEGFNGYLVKPVTGTDLENEIIRQLPKGIVHMTDSKGADAIETVSFLSDSNRKRRIVITTESTADLPERLKEKYNIAVFPISVRTADGVFKSGIEIDTDGLLKYMEGHSRQASPVLPKAEEYESFFAGQLETANNVIHISITGELPQSAYHVAKEAANSFDNVAVVDSRHMSGAQGIMAILASRMAEAGMSVTEIVSKLNVLHERIKASFMVDSMDYMARSGQINPRFANLTRALMMRPVSYMKNGKITTGGMIVGSKKRVWKRYIDKNFAGINANNTALFVNYVGLSKKELEYLKSIIEKKQKFDAIFFCQICPVIAISCGPGSFGLSIMVDE